MRKKYLRLIEKTSDRVGCDFSFSGCCYCSDWGTQSGAGFYASEMGKTWRMVIRKNITLVR